mgnify:FL=1
MSLILMFSEIFTFIEPNTSLILSICGYNIFSLAMNYFYQQKESNIYYEPNENENEVALCEAEQDQ